MVMFSRSSAWARGCAREAARFNNNDALELAARWLEDLSQINRFISERISSALSFIGLGSLLHFVHVAEHAARDANDKHLQVPPRPMLHTAGDVHDDVFVKLDFFIVESHPALALEHIVNLVRAFVVMELGVGDLEVVHFRRRAIVLFEQRTDLSAGLGPRLDFCQVAPQKRSRRLHGRMVRL